MSERRGAWVGFGAAIAVTVLATAASAAFDRVFVGIPFLPFFAAVSFAAWFGGAGPGMLAAVLGAAAATYILLPPRFSVEVRSPESAVQIGLFLAVSTMVCLLSAGLRRAQLRAEAERDDATRARARTGAVLESISDVFVALDREWRYTYVNRRAAEFVRRDPSALVGRSIWAEFPSVVGTAFERECRRAAAQGTPVSFRHVTGGGVASFDVRAYPSSDGLSIFMQDVTGRVRAERAAAEHREWLRVTLNSIGDAVIATDTAGVVTFLNPLAGKLTGWGDAAVGRPISEVFRIVNEQTRAPTEVPVDRVLRDGVTVGLANHTVLLSRGGRETPIDDSAAPIRRGDGVLVGVVLVFRDVAERRRAERRLAILAEAGARLSESLDFEQVLAQIGRLVVPELADWCSITLLDGRTVDRVDRDAGRLALVTREPALEPRLRELMETYPSMSDLQHALSGVLRTGEPFIAANMPAPPDCASMPADRRDAARQLGPHSVVVVPLTARGRVFGAITGVWADSDRRYGHHDLDFFCELARRAAIALDNADLHAELRRAVAAREEFLSVAAHELRTPIAGLRGYTQLALRRAERASPASPDGVRSTLQAIDQQATRLTLLANRLLDVSRVREGRLQLERERFDLAGLAARVVGQVAAAHPDHTIRLDTPPCLCLVADPLRIEQVLTNLLDNAIRYSAGAAEVDVALAARGVGGAVVTVRDRGRGIAPVDRQRVFERLQRAEGDDAAGLGLGLYISRQIVELHGGRIRLESPPDGGPGTVFTVELPPPEPAHGGV